MSIKSLETLEVWKRAKEFSLRIYREVFPVLPSEELDGEKLTQLINGYVNYLKRSKQGQNEPGASQTVREDIETYETN